MEIIPISEAKDRLTELADCVAREHDHFTLTRNGRPHAAIVSVAEWESLQESSRSSPTRKCGPTWWAAAAEARGDVTTEEEMAAIMAAASARRARERPIHHPPGARRPAARSPPAFPRS